MKAITAKTKCIINDNIIIIIVIGINFLWEIFIKKNFLWEIIRAIEMGWVR